MRERNTAAKKKSGRRPPRRASPVRESIRQRLVFDDETAAVRLDGFRMFLVYSTLLAHLKKNLVESVGYQLARGAVERLGYTEGSKITILASKLDTVRDFTDLVALASEVWALTGNAHARLVRADVDSTRGAFHAEFELEHSIEAEAQLEAFGPSQTPMCWLQTGWASGFSSAFAGKSIAFREIECVAMGHSACRLVGRPLADWQAQSDVAFHLRNDALVNRSLQRPELDPSLQNEAQFDDVVGVSEAFLSVLNQLRKVAPTRATVLLQGETGTGKEVFARLLHKMGGDPRAPFVAVNCAAIPESLIEAELFGVERGAFTGAAVSRPGRFELANGGVLFLDEIASLNLAAQAKLLRVLQEREVERLGHGKPKKIDVRVIAASNQDLAKLVQADRFRQDLYFRLSTFPIRLPSLKDRKEDIPLLIEHFLRRYCTLHRKPVGGLTAGAVQTLLHLDYPGNVRQLEHLIERAVILSDHDRPIDVGDLAQERSQTPDPPPAAVPAESGEGSDLFGSWVDRLLVKGVPLDAVARAMLERAVEMSAGNLTKAARTLGLSRRQLSYRLEKVRSPGSRS